MNPGDWIKVSERAQVDIGCPEGPHKILRAALASDGERVFNIGYTHWVRESHCVSSRPTAAQKERASMDEEGWRKRRDDNLRLALMEKRNAAPPSRDTDRFAVRRRGGNDPS